MTTTVTVRLSEQEAEALEGLCKNTGKSRSEVIRESLHNYRLRQALQTSQERLGPEARTIGWLNEDDVLGDDLRSQ